MTSTGTGRRSGSSCGGGNGSVVTLMVLDWARSPFLSLLGGFEHDVAWSSTFTG